MEGQGGGEVRRLHIIYFISRKGRIEHPHLIRVHHLARNGVRLRDVKRWLSELRGKDMPESYAWSYKRRYKAGFVWQDLLDEDLITPISDNEYVLKGSEIPSATFDNDISQLAEKEGVTHKEPPSFDENNKAKNQKSSPKSLEENFQTPRDMSTKPLLETEEESPPFSSETSTLTDDSMKFDEENHLDSKTEEQVEKVVSEKTPLISSILNKDKKKFISPNSFKVEKPSVVPNSSSASASKPKFSKSRSQSNNASSIFRNLITCGMVDTNDSGMMTINRRKSTSKNGTNKLDMSVYKGNKTMAEICRGDMVGGSERMSRISSNQQQKNAGRKSWEGANGSEKMYKNEMNSQKPVPAAYKPINGPNCSQCGKTFKPEKLHAHMKSCRGMKSLAKGGPVAAASSSSSSSSHRRSTDTPPRASFSSHYLIKK